MATPLPQTDIGFPRGTAFQPSLALGAAAGSEKAAPREPELKKPDPSAEKLPPRTTFAATAAAAAVVAPHTPATGAFSTGAKISAAVATPAAVADKIASTKATDKSDKNDEKPAAAPDWGFAKKKPRRGTPRIALVAALALASVGGGYVAYTRLWLNHTADDVTVDAAGQDETLLAQSNEPNDLDANTQLTASGDPFDDLPVEKSSIEGRTSATKEPRRVQVSDAMPINSRSSSDRTPSNRNSLSNDSRQKSFRESLELNDDDSPSGDANNTEPQITEQSPSVRDEEASTPTLDALANSADQRAVNNRSRSGSQGREPHRSQLTSGPRFSAHDDSEQVGGGEADDGMLEGYREAGRTPTARPKRSSGGPAISIVEASDDPELGEKLDGFVPQETTTRRASSKTVVIRPASGDRQSAERTASRTTANRLDSTADSAAFKDEAELDEAPPAPVTGRDGDSLSSKSSRGGAYGFQPRTTPMTPAADRRLMSTRAPATSNSQVSDPVSDTYRVAPDDSFWKISREQYGTGRYYQALARHNQDRVSDPQKMRLGTQILTPPAAVLEERYPDLIEKRAPAAKPTSGSSDLSGGRPQFEKPFTEGNEDERPARADSETASSGYFYSKTGEPLYRIGADDTLGSIAQRHLGRASRWHEIFEKNSEVLKNPDNLTLGTVIRLPADASRLSLVPEADRRR